MTKTAQGEKPKIHGTIGPAWPTWIVDALILGGSLLIMAATLGLAPSLGALGYMLPVFLGLGVLAVAGAATLFRGKPRALSIFVFVATIALDLSFRTRVPGETGLDWQNGMKLATWLLMLALAVRYYGRWRVVIDDPAVRLVVGFGVFCLMSSLWSPVGSYTFASAVGGLAWMGMAFVCATQLTDVDVIKPLVWSMAFECLIGLIVGMTMPEVGWLQDYDYEGSRLAGLSGHPNLLGQHSALLILIAWSAYELKAIRRSHLIGIEALAIVTLLLTGSRTAIIASVAALGLVYLRRHKQVARVVLSGAAFVVAIGCLAGASGSMPDFTDFFASLSRSGNASEIMTATNRSELWVIAWHHFLEHPILGWGFNGTEQLMMDSVDTNFPGNPVNAHNLLFQALMSLGLVGSITVIGYFVVLIYRFFAAPDPLRDRILIFSIALGVGEAELLSTPVVMSFLISWCVFRDARIRGYVARRLAPARLVNLPGQLQRI